MERKNYLLEGLSKEEKSYLKKIIVNVRRKYIRDNYDYLNSKDINWDTCTDVESDSLFDAVLNKCVDELESALEFERLFSDEKATEMNLQRSTIWRIKNKAQDKILKYLLGGK